MSSAIHRAIPAIAGNATLALPLSSIDGIETPRSLRRGPGRCRPDGTLTLV
jgi:hypothetical protein